MLHGSHLGCLQQKQGLVGTQPLMEKGWRVYKRRGSWPGLQPAVKHVGYKRQRDYWGPHSSIESFVEARYII